MKNIRYGTNSVRFITIKPSSKSDIFFLPTSDLHSNSQFAELITSKILKYFFTIFDIDIVLFCKFKILNFSILSNILSIYFTLNNSTNNYFVCSTFGLESRIFCNNYLIKFEFSSKMNKLLRSANLKFENSWSKQP